MPIAAVYVSPEVSEVIHSQSNKLGKLVKLIPVSFIHSYNVLHFSYLFTSFAGTFSHGFTYSGHPVPCAVAIETLKIFKFVFPNDF